MTTNSPIIVFVPGYWEGTSVFDTVRNKLLSEHGYETRAVDLISTGTSSPSNPNLYDDTRAVRAVVHSLVEEQEKEVILVLHSAGGFIGTGDIEGLGLDARKANGKAGGVREIIFLAGAVFPVETDLPVLPFMDFKGGQMFCRDPRDLLFNDFEDAEANRWMGVLKCQPASGYEVLIKHGAWKDIKSTYLVCKNDATVPPELQYQCAKLAGSTIQTCESGHMVMLKVPGEVVSLIVKVAAKQT